MSSVPERLSTVCDAARDARSVLGPLVSALDRPNQFPRSTRGHREAGQMRVAERLARVVGELYALEVTDAEGAHAALERALVGLRALLDSARASGLEPDLASTLARSLARLHPPSAELARALGHVDDADEVVPLLLSRKRQAGKAPEPAAVSPERRVEFRKTLEVDIGFASETNFYSGFSGDVSDGGLFVATWSVLPVGTELLLSFVLPGGRQITTKGRVQWTCEPHDDQELTPGMGISFDDVDGDALDAVRQFVAQREPIFHP